MEEKDNKLELLRELIRNLLKEIFKLRKIDYIIIHHTATDRDRTTFEAIDNNHKNRWNGKTKSQLGYYCGYTYLIEGNGKVWQARNDIEEGAHTRGHNRRTIGIGLTGNFEVEDPSIAQLNALEELLGNKMVQYGIKKDKIKCHSDISLTLCPGHHLIKWLSDFKGRK